MKEKEAVSIHKQTFYISFYPWGLQTVNCLNTPVFKLSRMKVVKVSMCIYYFWLPSDCIHLTLYWPNVNTCIP